MFISLRSIDNIYELATRDNYNLVREVENLIKLEGNKKNSLPFVTFLYELVVNILDCTDIKTTCRLYCNQKIRIGGYFTPDDCLLLITTGKLSSKRICTFTGTHIKFPDDFL